MTKLIEVIDAMGDQTVINIDTIRFIRPAKKQPDVATAIHFDSEHVITVNGSINDIRALIRDANAR